MHAAMQVVYPAALVIMGALIVLVERGAAAGLPAAARSGLARRRRVREAALAVRAGGGLRRSPALRVLSPPLRPVGYNVLLVLAFFFALQGLAVVVFYAHRLAAPPFLRVAVLRARAGEPVGPADPGPARAFRHLVRFPEVGRAAAADAPA